MDCNSVQRSGECVFPLGYLPDQILEHVLHFLPENELASLSPINKTFFRIINKIIRQSYFDLVHSTFRSLKVRRDEISQIPQNDNFLYLRICSLRSYFMIELLFNEIIMIKPLCRDLLFGEAKHQIYKIGPLVHELKLFLIKASCKDLPAWTINDEVTLRLLKFTKMFVEHRMRSFNPEKRCGSFILDMLNLMINKQYKITIQYYPLTESCSIHVAFVYNKPQFLNRPPSLLDVNSTLMSNEDKKNIMFYIMSIIRINNRITLREEQYYRELEYSARGNRNFRIELEELELSITDQCLWKSVRDYDIVLPNPSREILWTNGTFIVQEEYSTPNFNFDTTRKGFQM